jgi:quercetin dioxygenase-like cupin family protein
MKIVSYGQETEKRFDGGAASGVSGRVVIGKADGAANFCMRVFELDRDGFTPRHSHEWEHEIFFHAGNGEVWKGGEWVPVTPGTAAYIPGGEEHQIRNRGEGKLTFVCLIPSGAPEI